MAVDPERLFKPINIALLTVSDTRGPEDDTSGDILADRIRNASHHLIERAIEKDDVPRIVGKISNWLDDPRVDCIITTGGTGLTGRDVTPEALDQIKHTNNGKEIPGFGEIFRLLSYNSIGTSTVQSRAMGLVARGKYIFALPGDRKSTRLNSSHG